jgi:hypothetical protein
MASKPGQLVKRCGPKVADRKKLNDQILADMVEAWEFYGVRALKEMALAEPGNFVRAYTALLPKQVEVDITENMTEEQLVNRIRDLAATLGVEADLSLANPPGPSETTH